MAMSLGFSGVAYASDMDADSVIEKVSEETENIGSVSAVADMNCSMALNIGEEGNVSTFAISAAADFDIQYIEDPMALGLDGTFTVSAMGENIDLIVKVYAVPNDDGDYDTYIYTEDTSEEGSGEWQVETVSAEDMGLEDLEGMIEGDEVDTSDTGISFELADGILDNDGTDCYLLESVIDSEKLASYLTKNAGEVFEEAGVAEEDIAEIVEKLAINMDYYIDSQTYLPVLLHLDLNDGDFSFLNEYVQEAMGDGYETAELVFNDISIDIAFSFDDIEEIEIPEEALQFVQDETETEYVDSPEVGTVEVETDVDTESESEADESESSEYMVDTTEEEISLDLMTSISIGEADYTMPVNYDILTEAGWYTEDTDEVYSLELINDNYPESTCYVRWVTDDYEYFMPEEIIGHDIGYLDIEQAYDAENPEACNITFSGIGLGSSCEEVIEVFGFPTYCSYVGIGDTEVAYDYSLYTEDGYYYTLEFYINTDGLVSMVDYGIY